MPEIDDDRAEVINYGLQNIVKKIIGKNTKYIVLAHLSEKNNTEAKALEAVHEELGETKTQILIARQSEESPMLEV